MHVIPLHRASTDALIEHFGYINDLTVHDKSGRSTHSILLSRKTAKCLKVC